MTRTFIIPGDLSHLSAVNEFLDARTCGILLNIAMPQAEARRSASCPSQFAERLFTLESLTRPARDSIDARDRDLYDRALRAILGDARVYYLASRTYFDSALNSTVVIERVIVNALRIMRATAPHRLVSSSTPHSVEAWVFARCFESAGLPVFVLERTPINNRAWIYRGLDAQQVVARGAQTAPALSEYTRMQVREQIESKAGARDARGFYVSRMDLSSVKGAESNRWWSLRREFPLLFAGRLLTMPLRAASIFRKRQLFRSYRRHEVSALPDTPFVIFFMHYQPERSSLPEGLFHTQQLIALRQIADAMPKGWTLLVREHPTIWLLPLDISVRSADYFEQVAALPNTKLCPMDVDTFELIDRSAAVATLTGSVGFQALLRNKPAIVFGLPAYKDHPACFSAGSFADLERAFEELQRPDFAQHFSPESLEKYLLWVESNSIVADDRERDWLTARLKNFRELYRQISAGELLPTEAPGTR
ncbi:MAG TPA: hypothetical protein VK624_20435 [Steroidobacteraceae bacterium]|nr:hypothetical protein [Steroidobacteraceae bacterium]